MSPIKKEYSGEPGFCNNCGSIFPFMDGNETIKCYTCLKKFGKEVFSGMESFYTIHFNSYNKNLMKASKKDEESEGPVVVRKCPACGNEKMSYATLQLRSADEGQTVFYTCTNCKFKESENS